MTKQSHSNVNGLNKELHRQILDKILSYKDVEKIVLYGSRATDTFRKTSDIDIAVFAENWTSRDIALVHDSLEENVKTPLKIDLVNFYAITKESLKENILKQGVILYESK